MTMRHVVIGVWCLMAACGVAAAQGVRVVGVRAIASGIAGALIGIAGCLASWQFGYVGPGAYGFPLSVQMLFGLVIGGMHSLAGAVLGGLFLQFFPDLTSGLGKGLSALLYAVLLIGADDVVIVAAPDLGNLRHAKNIVDTLKAARPNDDKPKLVLNFIGVPKRPEIAIADFAKAVELETSAEIPFEPKLFGTAAARCADFRSGVMTLAEVQENLNQSRRSER